MTKRFILSAILMLVNGILLAQNDSDHPLVISAEQIASSFGYNGKLQAMDFASRGLTSPNVIQEINFTASDFTFLPTNIQVLTAGSLITPAIRIQLQNAPDVSGTGEIPSRKVRLPDGTTAYLFAMGGPGGDGYEAWMASRDGRFDLAVSVSVRSDVEYQQTASNSAYDNAMFEDPSAVLEKLGLVVGRIYPCLSC